MAYQLVQALGRTQTRWASSNDQDIDVAVALRSVCWRGNLSVNACMRCAYISSPVALVNCLLCPDGAMIAVFDSV